MYSTCLDSYYILFPTADSRRRNATLNRTPPLGNKQQWEPRRPLKKSSTLRTFVKRSSSGGGRSEKDSCRGGIVLPRAPPFVALHMKSVPRIAIMGLSRVFFMAWWNSRWRGGGASDPACGSFSALSPLTSMWLQRSKFIDGRWAIKRSPCVDTLSMSPKKGVTRGRKQYTIQHTNSTCGRGGMVCRSAHSSSTVYGWLVANSARDQVTVPDCP